jgi:hypothetical protein
VDWTTGMDYWTDLKGFDLQFSNEIGNFACRRCNIVTRWGAWRIVIDLIVQFNFPTSCTCNTISYNSVCANPD